MRAVSFFIFSYSLIIEVQGYFCHNFRNLTSVNALFHMSKCLGKLIFSRQDCIIGYALHE